MNYQNLITLNKNQFVYKYNILSFLKTTVFDKYTKLYTNYITSKQPPNLNELNFNIFSG